MHDDALRKLQARCVAWVNHLTIIVRRAHGSRFVSDGMIALLVFLAAALWAAKYIASGVVAPVFYQSVYAPAVMQACGEGFVSPRRPADVPGLAEFLQLKSNSFSCDAIPPGFEQRPLTKFQQGQRHLMGAVALSWQLAGVSWRALTLLYAILFGISSVAVYGIFRLAMSRPLALVLALAFFTYPQQLAYLPHLRDYAKAPFIIVIVLLLGWLVKYPPRLTTTLLIGVLAGAVIGVGAGFRMDVLIFMPAFLVTLAAFTPDGMARNAGVRMAAAGGFLLAFTVFSWPILSAVLGGGNTFHFVLLGLMSPFDSALDVEPSAVYEWGYLYHDLYMVMMLDSYGHRILNTDALELATRAYDQAGMAYYLQIVRQFPADIVLRVFAAIIEIVQYTGYFTALPWLSKLSPIVVLVSLFSIAVYNLRIAIFTLLAVVFLCGYPSLQFDPRHYFHLQFLPLFFYGFLVQQVFLHMFFLYSRRSRVGMRDNAT